MSSQLEVITYGGGDILWSVFNSVAMLTNSSGGHSLVFSLSILAGTIALGLGIIKSYMAGSLTPLVLLFALPVIAIPNLVIMPKASISIRDELNPASIKTVDNVPIVLAWTASTFSSFGYALTRGLEDVLHLPNDERYERSGRIFGSEFADKMHSFQITDPTLIKDIRSFCHSCISVDIFLGRYTMEELKKSGDLFSFLKERTSRTRLSPLCSSHQGKENGVRCPLTKCNQVAAYLEEISRKTAKSLGNEALRQEVLGRFRSITGDDSPKDGLALVQQSLMLNALKANLEPTEFAKKRAEAQALSTMSLSSSFAGKMLVSKKVVLESILYLSFVFILPLSLLPLGRKAFRVWSEMLLWVFLWSPTYVIIDFIQRLSAKQQFNQMVTDHGKGLSWIASDGLADLYAYVEANAGAMCILSGFLIYALIRGGVGSLIHLSNSIMSPVQSAVSSAAQEAVTGNYSYGNTSLDNKQLFNTSMSKRMLAPALSYGYMSVDSGMSTQTYSSQGNTISQKVSSLTHSFNAASMISKSLIDSEQTVASHLSSLGKTYQQSEAHHSKHLSDFTEHFAKLKNIQKGDSFRESYDIMETSRTMHSVAQDFANQHNLTHDEAFRHLHSASLGIGSKGGVARLGTDMNLSYSESETKLRQDAERVAKSSDFSAGVQKLESYAKSKSFSSGEDAASRLSRHVSDSFDEMKSLQNSYQETRSHLDQLSQARSFLNQESFSSSENLTQEFVEFAEQQYQDSGGVSKAHEVLLEGRGQEFLALRDKFCDSLLEKHGIESNLHISTSTKEEVQETLSNTRISKELDDHFERSGGMRIEDREKINPLNYQGYEKSVQRRTHEAKFLANHRFRAKLDVSEGWKGTSTAHKVKDSALSIGGVAKAFFSYLISPQALKYVGEGLEDG